MEIAHLESGPQRARGEKATVSAVHCGSSITLPAIAQPCRAGRLPAYRPDSHAGLIRPPQRVIATGGVTIRIPLRRRWDAKGHSMSSAQTMNTDSMAAGGDARLARAMDEALQFLDQAWSQAQQVEDVARLREAFSCLGGSGRLQEGPIDSATWRHSARRCCWLTRLGAVPFYDGGRHLHHGTVLPAVACAGVAPPHRPAEPSSPSQCDRRRGQSCAA